MQERLTNHAALAALGGTGLLTVRITGLVRPDCSVDVLAAVLRLPDDRSTDGPDAPPYRVLADVDPAAGRLRSAFAWRRGRSRPSERTPPAILLPDWAETLDLVRRAAPLLLPLRTAAWDVAPTPRGPVLLDVDADYPPWPTPSCRRVVDALAGAA